MIRAGELDRRITLQRQAEPDTLDAETAEWSDLGTVWAGVRPMSGSERFTAAQFVGQAVTTFRIRYSTLTASLTTKDRILYAGRLYDLTAIREIGRREGYDIDATTRSESPAS